MSEQLLSNVSFASLDLEPTVLRGVEEAGFEYCTLIQAEALPQALAGVDVEGQAQTGTGKTAAFLLATMNHLLRHPPLVGHRDGQPRAFILAPTRELAVQIHRDAELLGRYTGLRMLVVFGGTGYEQQRQDLQAGVDILIATPGRAIDYYKQRVFHLKGAQVAVLDEADRMFDLGFIRDVRYLLRKMPPASQRLNMLFSATLSHRVSELAYEHMNAPVIIDATPERVTVEQVSHVLYHVSSDEKLALLIGVLRRMDAKRAIVFANTKRAAEQVAAVLDANGFQSGLLTGDVPQKKRLALLERFKGEALPVLVATDVAARGLHIPDVTHVFNFDLPQDAEDYVHRVGRTARAGASGAAVSFECEAYVYSLEEIEAFIGQRIPTEPVADELLVPLKTPDRRRRRRPKSREGPRRSRSRGSRARHASRPGT